MCIHTVSCVPLVCLPAHRPCRDSDYVVLPCCLWGVHSETLGMFETAEGTEPKYTLVFFLSYLFTERKHVTAWAYPNC